MTVSHRAALALNCDRLAERIIDLKRERDRAADVGDWIGVRQLNTGIDRLSDLLGNAQKAYNEA